MTISDECFDINSLRLIVESRIDLIRFQFTARNFKLQEFMLRNLLKAFDKIAKASEGWKRSCEIMIEFGSSCLTANSSMNLTSNKSFNDFMSDKNQDEQRSSSFKGNFSDIDVNQILYLLNLYPIDIVCLQNITQGSQIKKLRGELKEKFAHVRIFSDIQKYQEIVAFEQLLAESDGIKISNKDLDLEIEAQLVRQSQQYMIEKANLAKKTVMTTCDTVISILDGTDYVMVDETQTYNKVRLILD